jgi:hypothetical protein
VVGHLYDPAESLSAHECSVTLFAAIFNPNNPSQEALFAKGIRLRFC